MKNPLVILIPNYKGETAYLDALENMLENETEELKDAYFLKLSHENWFFSNKDLNSIAQNICDRIENHYQQDKDNISEIILAGHSMGASLIRRAYLNTTSFGKSNNEWGSCVSRIVLLAGFGRGINMKYQPFTKRLFLNFAYNITKILRLSNKIRSMYVGSDFISKLRIDWIRYNQQNTEDKIKLVHLIGSEDLIAKAKDAIDIEQFPNSVTLSVAGANHGNIVIPSEYTKTQLIRAFTQSPDIKQAIQIQDAADIAVFLLHGIRDSRKCFEKVANSLEREFQLQNPNKEVKVITPTYGYLSIKNFLSPKHRNKFVAWFIDLYAEYLARNPNVEFYFAGHSNGTYILGEALKRIPRLRCKRLYLAASVLPAKYDWSDMVYNKQVDYIRSDMGTEDWPVGVLCRSLNNLGVKSLGVGGADGFHYGDNQHIEYHEYIGGHGAMLKDNNTQSIVDYLLNGSHNETIEGPSFEQSKAYNFFIKFGYVIFPIILILLFIALILLARADIPYYTGPISAFLISAIIWIVLSRF
jgi:pimeloyl-ACP methyl ester carboxylesterase